MTISRQFVGYVMLCLSLLLTTTNDACAQSTKQQKGKASYYSRRANGARTSSGERLNNDSLVCAHRKYPFGTKLLVRNPANGKEVVVRVIDRGPFVRGRIIDLSYEAARRIGMLSAGVAMVEVSEYDETKVPYKPKEYHAPELELEMNSGGDVSNPAWKKDKAEKEALKEKHRKEKSAHNAHKNAAKNMKADATKKETEKAKTTANDGAKTAHELAEGAEAAKDAKAEETSAKQVKKTQAKKKTVTKKKVRKRRR